MSTYYVGTVPYSSELYHHGIKGQRWGVRRFQNPDGSLTPAGRERYDAGPDGDKVNKRLVRKVKQFDRLAQKAYSKASNTTSEKKYKKLIDRAKSWTETADFADSMRTKYNSETPEYRMKIRKGVRLARVSEAAIAFGFGMPVALLTTELTAHKRGYGKLAYDTAGTSEEDKKKARRVSYFVRN